MTYLKFSFFILALTISLFSCEKNAIIEEKANELVIEWRESSNSLRIRAGHTSNVLDNGKILVTGAYYNENKVSIFDPISETWEQTDTLAIGRSAHQSIKLTNGKVMVMGGNCKCYRTRYTTSCETYDPASGLWTASADMNIPRSAFKATLLDNGQVLVTGGFNDSLAIATAELYDPTTDQWQMINSPNNEYAVHESIKLKDARILIIGGDRGITSEIYDPVSQDWSLTGSTMVQRGFHKAVLLNDGRVLVTGGVNYTRENDFDWNHASCEIYDPTTGSWSLVDSMNTARQSHTLTLLPNGKVLAIGGEGTVNDTEAYYPIADIEKSCEVYDPALNEWTIISQLSIGRKDHTTNLINDNQLVVIGGESNQTVEISGVME